jgi:hypothetical protein
MVVAVVRARQILGTVVKETDQTRGVAVVVLGLSSFVT